MPQKGEIPRAERRRVSALLQQDGEHEGACVVVRGVAFVVVRDRIGGVLEQACIVGHRPKMIEFEVRQLRALLEGRGLEHRAQVPGSRLAYLCEQIQIAARHDGPDHVAPKQIRPLPHRMPIRVPAQEIDDPGRDRLRIAERHEQAAALIE